MNPVVKEKWLAALESGEYYRGRNRLAQPRWDAEADEPIGTEYCCLGVLCDLAIKEGILDEIPESSDEDFRQGLYLPDVVEEWAALPYSIQEELAEINDDREPEPGVFRLTRGYIAENL